MQTKQLERPLRVAFLTPSLHIGGAERWILSLARNFQTVQPAGVVVCSPHHHPAMLEQAARLMPVYLARKVGNTGETRRLLERACADADVLITWGVPRLSLVTRGLVGRISNASYTTIPVIDVSHSDGRWQQQTKLVHRAADGADFHVAVSRCALSAFPEKIRRRATVIYNGVEVDRVAPRRLRNADCELRNPNERTALFLGRFEKVKGFDRLIAAAKYLPKNWKIVAHGHGSLANKIRTPHSQVRILPPVAHVGDALADADVLALPSRYEGMPLTLIEAWLAGTPTVTTPIGFVREAAMMHGPLTETVPNNPHGIELADGIMHAVRGKFAGAAREAAWNHYTAAAMSARWEEYLYAAVDAFHRKSKPARTREYRTLNIQR